MSKETQEAVGADDSLNDEELEGVCGGVDVCKMMEPTTLFAPAARPNIGSAATGAKKVPSGGQVYVGKAPVDVEGPVDIGELSAPVPSQHVNLMG